MEKLGDVFSQIETIVKERNITLRLVCFIIFIFVFFMASFQLLHATVTNNTLLLAVMILLLVLFTDLKSFSFWGITGEKIQDDLKKLEGKSGVDKKAVPKPSPSDVQKAETVALNEPFQQNDSVKGNFLTVMYDLERLMRIAASVLAGSDPETGKIDEILNSSGLLKDVGVQQLELLRRLKNLVIQGKDTVMDDSILSGAIKIASSLHSELNKWLLTSKKS